MTFEIDIDESRVPCRKDGEHDHSECVCDFVCGLVTKAILQGEFNRLHDDFKKGAQENPPRVEVTPK